MTIFPGVRFQLQAIAQMIQDAVLGDFFNFK